MAIAPKINCKINWEIFVPHPKWTLDKTGAQEEFTAKPVTHWLRDCTRDVLRYKMFPARKVMRVVTAHPPSPEMSQC
ncbi:MAG: hypothetical protein L3J36_07455 [Rhodobacteraceae bacterium]|nr:hypothetical protein [Paracoccaceae bacterium]